CGGGRKGGRRLDGDLVRGAEVAQFILCQVRVGLDLVGRRRNIALRMQPPQVVGLEVGDADRVRAALTVELAERMPGRDEISVVPRRQRPMNQEKVDIVETKRFQRLFERAAGVAWPMGAIAELCGDEYLIATQSRFRDGFADFLLVAVHLSSVDVP